MDGRHHQLSGHRIEMVKDREAWHPTVQGVSKSQTQLSDYMTRAIYRFLDK